MADEDQHRQHHRQIELGHRLLVRGEHEQRGEGGGGQGGQRGYPRQPGHHQPGAAGKDAGREGGGQHHAEEGGHPLAALELQPHREDVTEEGGAASEASVGFRRLVTHAA